MAKRKTPSARQLLSLQKADAPGNGAVAESTQSVPTVASGADTARQRIAEAAYYRAEKRGFAPGCELDDWFAAEAELAGSSVQQTAPAAELH
jgi:hypothetical protein